MAMLAPKLLPLLVALNIASALGQTCQQGVGDDGLYTLCSFTIGTSTYEVPTGVSTLAYRITGGQGGIVTNVVTSPGSSALLEGNLDLLPSSGPITLSIIVATAGKAGRTGTESTGGSGYGNGGSGGSSASNAGGGGGSTAILISGSDTVLVVAAGGGGAGYAAGAVAPGALDDVEDPSKSPNGSNGAAPGGFLNFPSGGGSGGGYRGGGGSQAGAGLAGNPGRSYYNPLYGTAPAISSTLAAEPAADGSVSLTFLTPLAPSGGGGTGRQRARRLRRRNVCAHNHRVCNKRSALCVNLKTSFEHCGTCFNDCSELGDRAICNDGICQSY